MATAPALSVSELQILRRVDNALSAPESELRYQLERKDEHPLARSEQLLDVLVDLEARGLLVSELHFRLTTAGRAALDDDPS